MLTSGKLVEAFRPYWEDMERCRTAKAYWALLHVTVCIPDICAALEAEVGEATQKGYKKWCDENLDNALLDASERYRMRCKVLHQGRATTDKAGRYDGFAFGQPSSDGYRDHMRADGKILHVDVGSLAEEMKVGFESWVQRLEANAISRASVNVARNLKSLVRVAKVAVPMRTSIPGAPKFTVINKTN